MSLDIFAKALAPSLGYEKAKVDQYIHKLLELAIEELLIQGEVKFAGIGILKRMYHPAEPREKAPGELYLYPPSQSIDLIADNQFESGDFVYDTAISQFQMSEENALRFSKGFAVSIEKSLAVRGKLDLGILGSFQKVEEQIKFKESLQLTELLKKPYENLKPAQINKDLDSKISSQTVGQAKSPKAEPISPAKKKDVELTPKPQVTQSTPAQPEIREENPAEPLAASSSQPKAEDDHDLNWLYEEKESHNNLYFIIGGVVIVLSLLAAGYWMFTHDSKTETKELASENQKTEQVMTDSSAKSTSVDEEKAEKEDQQVEAQKPVQKQTVSKSKPSVNRTTTSNSNDNKPWFVPPSLTKKLNLSEGGYAISVASLSDKTKADRLANSYNKKGFAVTVWQVDVKGTTYYRVLISSFTSHAKAVKAKDEAGSQLPPDAFIVKIN